jgi:AcrR family transcriptional regulator
MAATDETRILRADARRNRDAIIAAASTLFSEQGIDAQVPDIAKAANVGVGTVYRHFPTKEDLIAALLADRFSALAEAARESLEFEDSWEGLAHFIRVSTAMQAEDRGLCEIIGLRPDMTGAAAEAADMPALAEQLVRRPQREGKLRRDVTWEDIPMITCGLGSVTQQAVGPASGRWPRLVEIIIDGLRAPGAEKLPPPLFRHGEGPPPAAR